MPKSREVQDAGVVLLFLRWHVKIQCHLVSDVMRIHLSTATKLPGFPQHLSVGTAIDWWLLEARTVTRPRCQAAYAALPWKLSIISSPTSILWSKTVKKRKIKIR